MMLLLGAVLGVALIYLLRPPAQQVLVPSSLLWDKLVKETANRRRWLRWLLSLLLSALIVVLLLSMILRLEPNTGGVQNPVLLVDNTGSMGTLNAVGGSDDRLQTAKRRATEILSRSSGTITIADLAGTVGPVRFDNTADARRALDQIRFVPGAKARIPEQLFSPVGTASGGVYLLSDNPRLLDEVQRLAERIGADSPSAADRATPSTPGAGATERNAETPTVEMVDVYTDAANVGIIDFSSNAAVAGTLDLQNHSAFLDVLNGGSQPVDAHLRLDVFPVRLLLDANLATTSAALGDLEPLLERELSIAGGANWTAAIDLASAHRRYPLDRIAVRALVQLTDGSRSVGDAQPLDDTAWIILDPLRTRLVAAEGVASLPRWLTRVIATSGHLELVRAQPPGGAPAVTIYPAGASPADNEPFTAPCMVLPPRLTAAIDAAAQVRPHRVVTAFPQSASAPGTASLGLERAPLQLELPWTEVQVVEQAAPIANPWVVAETTSINGADDSNAVDTTRTALIAGPSTSETDSCVHWLFDPEASLLETRAEFPAFVERLSAAALAVEQQRQHAAVWQDQRRQLVAGSWQNLAAQTPPLPGVGLVLADSQLIAPARAGTSLTVVAKSAPDSAESRTASPSIESQTTISRLGWPKRAALAGIVILFLLIEATTRFAGVTE